MNSRPVLYFFDMDETLIDNDCDVSWKKFMVEKNLAPKSDLALAAEFFAVYHRGELEPEKFLEFQLREFRSKGPQEMEPLFEEHFKEYVEPKIFPEAVKFVKQAQASGALCAIMTATNSAIARPLADHLGIREVIATEPEQHNGVYTGRMSGYYVSKEGKVRAANEFCAKHKIKLADTAYLGDSTTDLYILRKVGHPIVVNPKTELRQIAKKSGWKILKFK